MKYTFLTFIICFLIQVVSAQEVYQPVSSSVYEFLDELAGIGAVDLNSVVKPYSRILIAEKLSEATADTNELNKRQQKELEFYLRDFNKELEPEKNFKKRIDLFFYKDSLLTITVNPILGFEYYSNENGNAYHRWNGAEAYGTIGRHFGFSASLRDNGISEDLFGPEFLIQSPGANYKVNQGKNNTRTDYSEMKGGISYSWEWGSIALLKDNFIWGNNYNGSNIFSGRQPSFAYLSFKLHPVKWLNFNYIHGWLISEVIDSAATYSVNSQARRIYRDKYLAANMYTITPFKRFNISFGNSIIYSDYGVQPGYLIPFFFYKSVDHTYNGTGSNNLGQNSQMFFDISSRQIKKLHLYSSLFIDEIHISKILKKEEHTNIVSVKAGFKLFNVLVPNTAFTFEYTRSNPWAYQHQIATTSFESNNYNLGHYLEDNAEEIYVEFIVKPIRGLHFIVSYTQARKGEEVAYQVINGSANVKGLPFIENTIWSNKTGRIKVNYEVINDGYLYAEYVNGYNVGAIESYTPELFRNNTNTLTLGMNYGF